MDQALLNDMINNAVHFGHKTKKWNPKMKKYIHGKVKDIHVINLIKTAKCLEEALDFLKKTKSEGKTILIVGTKDQTVNLVKDLAEKINMPYINSKWIGGFITNFSTMRTRINHLKKLKEKKKTGEFEKYTKKEQSTFEKEIIKLGNSFGGVENLSKTPDAVLVTDVCKDKIAIREANKLGIPVVGFCDTNGDPDMITYPIPANDDSIKSLTFLFKKIELTLI